MVTITSIWYKDVLKIFFILFFLIVLSGCGYEYKEQNKRYNQNTQRPTSPTPNNPSDNIAITRRSKYSRQKLLNNPERDLYWKLVTICKNNKVIISAQVNLGEILQSEEGYKTIQCKRCDFCITDRSFNPLVVIEYNGSGHFNDTSKERDEIKKTAIESSGIALFIITENNKVGTLNEIKKFLREKTGG